MTSFVKKYLIARAILSKTMRKIFFISIPVIILLGLGFTFGRKQLRELKKEITQAWIRQSSNHRLSSEVKFQKFPLGDAARGKFTSLLIGPDKKLYAGRMDGQIHCFKVYPDGTLGLNKIYKPFNSDKLLIGLEFQPNIEGDTLLLWATYSDYPKIYNGPAWNGRLARLTLDAQSDKVLENQLVFTNLPRSGKDHLTNSLAFGPDGALYFNQGSNTAMGRAEYEKVWGFREESLLSATILRVDLAKLPSDLPLDVKTQDAGGNYDPFHPDAPLTIYVTGLRNAYDLVWHSNGELYVPINGSMGGKNLPTSNPEDERYIAPFGKYAEYDGPKNIPAIDNYAYSMPDFMYRIEKGRYYGHPNPIRAEYVLNRGDEDVNHSSYRGIKPGPNYHQPIHDFGLHASPNGIVEYKNDAFGGKLQGMMLVTRYNMYHDLFLMEPSPDGKGIKRTFDGEHLGLSEFHEPLDVTMNPDNGIIYVSELGGKGQIVLVIPRDGRPLPNAMAARTPKENVFQDAEVSLEAKPSLDDPLLSGEVLFEENCVNCHGEQGEGGTGPSLQDDEWIYGGSVNNIAQTLRNGARNGMPSWKDRLNDKQISSLARYVHQLRHKKKISMN